MVLLVQRVLLLDWLDRCGAVVDNLVVNSLEKVIIW